MVIMCVRCGCDAAKQLTRGVCMRVFLAYQRLYVHKQFGMDWNQGLSY